MLISLLSLTFLPASLSPSTILWTLLTLVVITLHLNTPLFPNSWLHLDNLALPLIMLTMITLILISLSSPLFKSSSHFILPISLILLVAFSSADMMLFYISFELVLIPTFFLITRAGNQPERLQAAIYLILYTVFASLPLLGAIIFIAPTATFTLATHTNTLLNYSLLFTLAFLVKLPMFFTHLWLPKAHVEAPMEGSMILAAILLKLGGYGIIRFAPLLAPSLLVMSPWIISISLVGATLTSFNCTRQKDLKALIAYSSVAHMALVISSIFSMKTTAPSASMMMMVGHGLSSSALFFLVNILYLQHHTRNLISFKGLIHTFPSLTLWWFLFIAANISAPPSINFLSELLIMSALVTWNPWTILTIISSSLTTATFSILLYSSLTHAHNTLMNASPTPSPKQFLSLISHFTPIILLMTKPELLST